MKKIITLIYLCAVPFLIFAQLQQTTVSKTNKEVTNEMINIPLDYDGEAGIFTMGYNSSSEYQVTLTYNFDISKYMITNSQYTQMLNEAYAENLVLVEWDAEKEAYVVKNTDGQPYEMIDLDGYLEEIPCRIQWNETEFVVETNYEDHPVTYVTWMGAAFFCNMQSQNDGLTELYDLNTNPWGRTFYEADGYRLATKEEWEYAASYNDERLYPWGDEIPSINHANFDNNVGHITPVNEYPLGVSELGLWDMTGNCGEMTNNYDVSYTEPQINPTGPETVEDTWMASKGASYEHTEGGLKLYWQGIYKQYAEIEGVHQSFGFNNKGFRMLRTYSGTPQTINNIDNKLNTINNYPNPANTSTTFIFYVNNESNGTIIIQNINGQVVDQINIETKNGKNVFLYNTENLNNGIYFYTFKNKNSIISNKMIISH